MGKALDFHDRPSQSILSVVISEVNGDTIGMCIVPQLHRSPAQMDSNLHEQVTAVLQHHTIIIIIIIIITTTTSKCSCSIVGREKHFLLYKVTVNTGEHCVVLSSVRALNKL